MSQRSMLEINHDYTPDRTQGELEEWAQAMCRYLASGDPTMLPRGVTFFRRRHHSEPCALGDPPHGWDNDQSAPKPEQTE